MSVAVVASESLTQQLTVTIADDDNSAPMLNNLSGAVAFTEDSDAVVLDSDVNVTDTEFNLLNSGAGNYTGGSLTIVRSISADTNDVFSVAAGTNYLVLGSDITTTSGDKFASFSSASGTLTVTFSGDVAIPTNALVNEVMQNITYSNSSDAPNANVQLNWTFSDGSLASSGGANITTVTITPINDAPVLDINESPTFTTIIEDVAPADNVGTSIASLIVDDSITDADENATEAIAIVAIDNSNGIWQYTTDNGSSWSSVSATTGQSVDLK